MPRKKKTADPALDSTVDADQAELDAAHQTRKSLKRQAELPGVERESDKVLDELAAEWVEVAGQRASLGTTLAKLKDRIERAMNERGITRYRFIDGEVAKELVVSSKQKVRVVKANSGDGDEGDEGDE